MHAVVSAALLCALLTSSSAATRERNMENVDVRLVDVQMLVNVSREMVNGAYIALSEDAYIRRVDDAHVYFTLQRMVMPGNSKSKADWRLEGFQCDDVDGGAGVCVKFAAVDLGELEVQHPDDEEKLQYVFRQNAVKHRHLQFESDDKLNEAIVGAYYDCALAGGDNWCCNTSLADADTAASGPTCWYLPPDPDISKDCWLDS
uniref:Uncharacterized protein n=1 Tax=Globisporangium ultimum (strain ATCC 200006 / CBS 805.95 / DAOM BR144) TaxID=431595 RepID=K3WDZ4_GLOUD